MNTLIAITGLGVLCLLFEILNFRKAIVPFTIAGLLAILGLTISEFGTTGSFYYNMIEVSKFSQAFSALFIVIALYAIISMRHTNQGFLILLR
jgi:NADH-quinone oxidoreductase subunit N